MAGPGEGEEEEEAGERDVTALEVTDERLSSQMEGLHKAIKLDERCGAGLWGAHVGGRRSGQKVWIWARVRKAVELNVL